MCPGTDCRRRCVKDSQFWKDKSLTEGCVRCGEDEGGRSVRDEGASSSSVETEGICVSKNLDETVRLHSEKR